MINQNGNEQPNFPNLPNPLIPDVTESLNHVQYQTFSPLAIVGWDPDQMLKDSWNYFKYRIFKKFYQTMLWENEDYTVCFECKKIFIKNEDIGHFCDKKPMFKCNKCFKLVGCHICG